MRYSVLIFILLISIIVMNSCQTNSTDQLSALLKNNADKLAGVMDNPEKYEVQIIYTQIDRDSLNNAEFTTFRFMENREFYYYPASTVKLPASILALEKINELNIPALSKDTPLSIDSSYSGQIAVSSDTTSESGLPSIAHYIKKILLVSNNDAFNRLYEFLGQDELNERLHNKGLNDCRLIHRLSITMSPDENRHTNGFRFYNDEEEIYHQPPRVSEKNYNFNLVNQKKGNGYYKGGKLVEEPMDFSKKNYISLNDQHEIIKRLFFPGKYPEDQRFRLTEEDYKFLYKYMSMFPGESDYPAYDSSYNDGYVKFFMFGDAKEKLDGKIRVFSKSGMAYGFLIDNAYIVDFENNVEFLLSAVIHVNEDGIYNDDKYEYDSVGVPFLANLGRIIYNYELERNRPHIPDLSHLKFQY